MPRNSTEFCIGVGVKPVANSRHGRARTGELGLETMLLRTSESRIQEVSPRRLVPSDRAGIRAQLDEQGFACVRGCLSPPELERAEELLWRHLEGVEEASQRMAQKRPIG